ncbi:MAG: SgcJ/EcaC family oxidoreductase [Planctomycetes bacterium]|nr:SgcJ/EcaC family oxidoreductase [Planctomycetota bacterium]
MNSFLKCLAALLVALAGAAAPLPAQAKDGPEEAAIRKSGEAFVEAFNKGDAAALAAFYTADADYIDQAGKVVKGKAAIEKTYQQLFADQKGAKLTIGVTSIRFVKPDLALLDGVTEVVSADGGPPTNARYSSVHVLQDGKWLIASVREMVAHPPSNHEHLESLEFLVGDWEEDVEKGSSAKISYSWAENQNFLVSTFAMTLNNVPVTGGTQWIGWDAKAKTIRSWAFDSGGGFGEGTWSVADKVITISNAITTRDGVKIAATNVVTKVDADHFTWQSTKRTADGKMIPDTDVVKMKRVKTK